MNNNTNKMVQASTPNYLDFGKKNSESFYSPTPMVQQPTPQMINYLNGQSPINSPNVLNKSNLDIMRQQSNLQIYNNITTTSPNYGMGQTPAMNFQNRANSPRSPLNNLAGSSPAQPNNITMYRGQNSNLNFDNRINTYKSGLNSLNISPEIQPKLQNIVSTANLGCTLRLRQIALQARNAEYNPKRFAAVIMRIREPKTTALIFSSGKMVCTGAKSEEDSKKASRKYAKIIRSLGFPVEFKEFKVQNIVGSCDVKFQISYLSKSLFKRFILIN